MEDKISILIADDHPIFCRGLKDVIESNNRFCVVAKAENGKIALKYIAEYKPNIAILDIDMPVTNGFEVVRALRDQKISIDIIILTMYKEEEMFHEAIELGVKGYLLKDTASQDVIECIQAVASGNYYISPYISSYLISKSERLKSFKLKYPSLTLLTVSERRILKLIAENKTSKDIADELFISYKTVENHRNNIATKLKLHGPHELLRFALENKTFL